MRFAAFLAFLVVLVATTLSYAAPAERLHLAECQLPEVKEGVRCGTFQVRENRDIANGRLLSLKVIVVPAHAAHPKDPIFLLSGGPGQAATDAAGEFAKESAQLYPEHDIVLMDLRGTGEGTRLDCSFGADDEHLQDYMEPLFHKGTDFQACAEQLSKTADLSQYTTANSMRDLDELRTALGYSKINLYGGSYGTRAGLVYLHMFGPHVHSAVFSGLSPLANRSPLYHAQGAERALEILFSQCVADTLCHRTFPDPMADLREIQAKLRTAPARVTVKHPVSGKPVEILLTASAFADGLRVMLYSEEGGRRVPLLLQRARQGDYTPFAQAALANGRGLTLGLRAGLLLAVSCTEDTARIRPEEIEPMTAGSFIGDARVHGQMGACAVWPRTRLPADFFAAFTSDVPVLLVSGNLDPVTPPQWGEEAAKSFPNSRHLVLPTAHVGDSDCVDQMTRTLFDTGELTRIDTSCIASIKLPPFAIAETQLMKD